MTGIVVVNKPMDYTSHDVIAILRGILGEKKIGHTGTLDPNATGVLPVCLGKATRLIEYMENSPKSYFCRLRLGMSSDTDDIWGNLTDNGLFSFPSQEEIEHILKGFLGDIDQIPPMYSRVSVNGRRLISYARNGEEVEVKPRKIHIYEINMTGYYPCQNEITFNVVCSRGTYIRSICHDIGDIIGCGGVMAALVRTATSGFDLNDAIDFEEIRKMPREDVLKLIRPIDESIDWMPKIEIDGRAYKMFSDGMTVRNAGEPDYPIAVMHEGSLVGIAQREDGYIKPIKVFHWDE